MNDKKIEKKSKYFKYISSKSIMNIFFLHLDPKTCAMMHVNRHVVKMILESTQILCSVHHVWKEDNPNYGYTPPYKLAHKNHPCCIWARTSLSNYIWLIELAKELCKEYTYRYGKIHKCESRICELEKNLPPLEDKGFTPPAQAMPETYRYKDPVEAYRQYYIFEKYNLFAWKEREEPQWIKDFYKLFQD